MQALLEFKEKLNIYVFIQKERFALLEYSVTIPLGQMILRSKSRDKMTTGNNKIKWNNFRYRTIVP